MNLISKIKFLTIFLLFPFLQAFAQNVYSFTGNNQNYLGKELRFIQDTTHELEYDDIYRDTDLERGNKSVLNLNFSKHPYWFKLDLVNHSDTDLVIFELSYSLLDTVEVYFLKDGKLISSYQSGDNFDIGQRPYRHQSFLANLNLEEGEQGSVIFKVRSNTPILIPVRLNSPTTFFEQILLLDFFKGIYLGIMFVMFFYNLIIFFITKDRNYIFYISYILFIYLTQASLDGTTYRHLFYESPHLYDLLVISFPALAGIFALEFIKSFLHVKELAPKFYPALIVVQFVYGSAIVLSLLGLASVSFRIVDFTAAGIALYTLIMAINLVLKGYRPAKFFLVAWLLFLIGLVIFVLRNLGVLQFNDFTSNVLHIGTAIEVILLSIALADKINILTKEKEESQAQALKALKENERMIREQNIILEQRVQERTLELQESNEELQVTLTNLKDTQTQLVDAEKMASLGQLTAGIAHEINNPINFVTSNITPLKRDLEEVYEIIEAYSAVDVNNAVEGLRKAHELQEEYDFAYLKEEISSLVNGISDGATRTSEIVKGLRVFSRLDEDTIKHAHVHDGLNSTLVLLRNKTKDQVEVEKMYEDGIPDIECYPGKLNQVFMNILNNALYAVNVKHYSEGEKPKITLITKKEGNKVKLHIIDNGIGMNEQTKKKIFEPFFTTKDVGEGTGLGMSIVFKIIEKHKGSIEVNSEPGKGTEFIITLPVRLPNQVE